jgi:GT2 family glycosyltransferase
VSGRVRGPLAVSVVMPCHKRIASLERAVRSVLASADAVDGEVEVVLVDDCSPTPIREALEHRITDPRVRYLRHDTNRGPAAARNTGVTAARHQIVLFTDDDVVVDVAWIERLARYLADAPRRVGGVGGRVRALGDDLFSRYFEYHHILDPFRMDDGRVLYVVTACCGYRRSVLQEVGGFDEDVKAPGGEDPGLAFKVAGAGYELHVVEDALVHHDFRLGLRNFWRTFRRYGSGCRHQVERHWKGFAPPRRAGAEVATYGGNVVEVPEAEAS